MKKEKLQFTADVSALTDYINGSPEEVITNILMTGQSFERLNVRTGIKTTERRPDLLSQGVTLQTGDYTGTDNYSGGVAFGEVDLSVTDLFIKERYAKNEFTDKVTQLAESAGSDPEDFPYQSQIQGLKGQELNRANEALLMRGSTSGSGNLRFFNGWLTQILAANDTKDTGTAGVALTSSNALAQVQTLIDLFRSDLPDQVETETYLFMAPVNFQIYYEAKFGLAAAIDANTVGQNQVTEFRIPGTSIIAISWYGLTGSNDMFITRPDNLNVNTDLENEAEELSVEYLTESLIWRLLGIYKLGAKVARTNEVVVTKA